MERKQFLLGESFKVETKKNFFANYVLLILGID